MKIEIEIPDLKFKVGDFIQYTETETLKGLCVIARVEGFEVKGNWSYYPSEKPQIDISEAFYTIVVQEEGFTTEKTPLRPGMLFWCSLSDIHTYARQIDYKGKVWEKDTIDNLRERLKAFEK